MTRAVGDRILKDVNGNISDHLRNHIHLTNCIHLKNHMHKHSPILADRALMRDLVVLQRSRSLRDPSASPSSWHSPSVVDVRLKRGETDDFVSRRQSVGTEHVKEFGRMSGGSPPITVSKSVPKVGASSRRREKREEAGCPQDGNDLVRGSASGNSELRGKKKGGYRQDKHLKTLSDRLKDVAAESEDAVSSHNQVEKVAEEARTSIRQGSGLNRGKRRRFRGTRRTRPFRASQEGELQNEMSVASNSFAQGRLSRKYQLEGGLKGDDDQNVTGLPRNACGIPWNWSSIHHRGKSFLDMAGRSFSCGISESRFKKGGSTSRRMDISDMPVVSELSSSSAKYDAEALPLLLDGSQGSADRGARLHDYSGELGIFADDLLKQETNSPHQQQQHRHHRDERHQNLTQKYMPRMFRDLVGQSLVVQALSNAIAKKKIGMMYLFYGPHGTGKTSCARIFASGLNCRSVEQPQPCGLCNSCILQNKGKSRNVRELGPVSNFDFESIIELLDNVITSHHQSQYQILIFDECDTLASEYWSAILKIVDRAPRHVVFVLVCSSLEALPHVIISRCQKFFFPKIKDADIIYTLQWIATKEDLEIDKDALKLIASRSDGSLRDAEMTLEQLSLLGKRISLGLVQELVGLVSDEKLVDLLDLALSADTVNTVKNLRDIMESGVDPLALMSQLATVITDILAGSHDFMKEKHGRKFFLQQMLSKEDMEKLRQALKTLSEAEKQLRVVSNDRITWLTAALLQLAPDQQYMLPNSSGDTNFDHNTLVLNNGSLGDRPRKSNAEMHTFQASSSRDVRYNAKSKAGHMDDVGGVVSRQVPVQFHGVSHQEIEEIWFEVLEKIPINSVKEFLYTEGKLISVCYGTAPTVQLQFNSSLTRSRAEKFRLHILQAFESVLKSPVTIEIRCEPRKDAESHRILLPTTRDQPHLDINSDNDDIRRFQDRGASSSGANRREIVEIEASPPREYGIIRRRDDKTGFGRQNFGNSGLTSAVNVPSLSREANQSLSLVRSKISLAHVIQQQAEARAQHNGWSKRNAVSIAEKLEQENLKLEPRSRNLLCWKAPKATRRKHPRVKIRVRKPQALLKFVSCGKCLSSRSPSQR